ncbi:MAG TPA: zf-HC2 domain-containing protein [Terriglobales bacterium]|nr:zf-HC2 domain-containing protein [Terriglobales bacterium]
MDHNAVVQQKMTERYLLNELEPEERDEFEEHFFDCQKCAQDIQAGSEFVEHSKVILAESSDPIPVRDSSRETVRSGWFAWLRPAFAVPLLAVLLAIVGYQNLVMYPKLRGLTQPRVLPWASVAVGTWGAARPPLTVPEDGAFLLFVRIPPDGNYASYTADLYNPKGKLEWSLTFPAKPGQDQWPMQIPGADREAGTYRMSVRGVTAAGDSKDLGSTSFELQIQK